MKRLAAYSVAAFLLVAVSTGLLWPWVGADARRGLVLAAAIALVFQVVAFGLLIWARRKPQGFLVGLAGGMLARMGLVAVVALGATAGGARRPWTVAVVLGLVGYLFALVLLEAWFIQERADSTQRIERTS